MERKIKPGIYVEVDRDGDGVVQMCILELDENRLGHGYRIIGSKYFLGTNIARKLLTPDDAKNIREYLDKIDAPLTLPSSERDAIWNKAVENCAKEAVKESERHSVDPRMAGTHYGWIGGKIADRLRALRRTGGGS